MRGRRPPAFTPVKHPPTAARAAAMHRNSSRKSPAAAATRHQAAPALRSPSSARRAAPPAPARCRVDPGFHHPAHRFEAAQAHARMQRTPEAPRLQLQIVGQGAAMGQADVVEFKQVDESHRPAIRRQLLRQRRRGHRHQAVEAAAPCPSNLRHGRPARRACAAAAGTPAARGAAGDAAGFRHVQEELHVDQVESHSPGIVPSGEPKAGCGNPSF